MEIYIFEIELTGQCFKDSSLDQKLKIIEILQKCCFRVDFLPEIAFNCLVRAN